MSISAVKYYKYQKYLKYLNGIPQNEYKKGQIIDINDYPSKEECELGIQIRWIETEDTICNGYSLYKKEIRLRLIDNEWIPDGLWRLGLLIEENSTLCGWQLLTKWLLTGKTRCSGFILQTEYQKYQSTDLGQTWQSIDEYKYEDTDKYSSECIPLSKPLVYEVDSLTEMNIYIPKRPFFVDYGDGIKENVASFTPLSNTIKVYGLYTSRIGCSIPYKITDWGEKPPSMYLIGDIQDIPLIDWQLDHFRCNSSSLKIDLTLDCDDVNLAECGITSYTGRDGLFTGCTNLIKCTTTIKDKNKDDLFNGCISLESIDGINLINCTGNNAFKDCIQLKEIDLTNISSIINSTTFIGCDNLTKITGTINNGPLVIESLEEADLTVSNADNLFIGCPKLSIFNGKILGSAVSTFKGCSSLIKINNDVFNDNIFSNPYFKYDNCFEGCTSLIDIPLIPSKAKNTSLNYMFKDCTSIVEIPNDLIVDATFNNDNISLKGMFEGCTSLANYPIINNTPIWDWLRFKRLDKSGKESNHFDVFKSTKISNEVPESWGGVELGERPTILSSNSLYSINGDILRIKYGSIDEYQPNSPVLIPRGIECSVWFKEGSEWWTNANKVSDFGSFGMPIWDKLTNLEYAGIGPDEMQYETMFNGFYSANLSFIDSRFFKDNLDTIIISQVENNSLTTVPTLPTNCTGKPEIFNNLKALTTLNSTLKGSKFISAAEMVGNVNIGDCQSLFEGCTDLLYMDNWMIEATSSFNASSAFKGCTSLKTAYLRDENDYIECFKDCTSLTNIVIKDIGAIDLTNCFENCTSLIETPTYNGKKLWEYPDITGDQCFKGCTQLKDYDEIPNEWK